MTLRALLPALFVLAACSAAPEKRVVPSTDDVYLRERLGAQIDKSLRFRDETGKATTLGDAMGGDRPVVLVLSYYTCPALCGLVLRGVVASARKLDWRLGTDYRLVTVSFDPADDSAAARAKQATSLAALGASATGRSWPFLTGSAPSIRALATALGFGFVRDPQTAQYAHPAAIFVLTPDGRVSRYLYGVEYPARDLRLALIEAGEGRVGTLVERVLLTCYEFDPASRRYGPSIIGFVRLGGAAILLCVSGLLLVLWVADRRRVRTGDGRRGSS